MALVRKIADETVASGTVQGTQIVNHSRFDESGAVQYIVTAGTVGEIELQGRMSDELNWVEVATSGAMGGSDPTDVLQTGVAVLPYMRAVAKTASLATYKVYFME